VEFKVGQWELLEGLLWQQQGLLQVQPGQVALPLRFFLQ